MQILFYGNSALEDFLFLYRGYKALGGNSFIDRIKSEIDEWEVVS